VIPRTAALVLATAALGRAADENEAPHLARVMPPAGHVTVARAIEEGMAFLVANQNADGSFGRAATARTYELWCDVPGGHQAFMGATTALCWMGLDDARAAGYATDASRAAQARCLAWLVKHARVKRPFPEQFYNVWSLAYGLRALSQALREGAEGADPESMRATCAELVSALGIYQSPDGGWGYLDFNVPAFHPSWSTSFTTGTVLVGLHEAREAGIEVPQAMVDRALKLMWRFRTPDGNYVYSIDHRYYPQGRINRAGGSSMRNQNCNLAIHLFQPERMTREMMRTGLERFVEQHRFAIAGLRRPVPHESWYQVSGYFYLYGQQYTAMVLERMTPEDRTRFWPDLVRYVLKTRQPEGSFWDYPTYGYHKFYGTGYALMTLARCPAPIAEGLEP